MVKGLKFGDVIDSFQSLPGARAALPAWSDGEYITLVDVVTIPAGAVGNSDTLTIDAYISKWKGGHMTPGWIPSTQEMFADCWVVFSETESRRKDD